MTKNRDIIIVGLQPWDTEIGSNCKNIALEFSKNNRVLYVNSPLDRKTIIYNKDTVFVKKRLNLLKGKREALEKIQQNLWVYNPDVVIESINWIKIRLLFNFLNRINNRRISGAIKRVTKQLNFENYILFNDNDIFRAFYLKDYLKPRVSIYYSRDYLLGVDYWKYHGKILEPKLIAKSDLCVANSVYLKEYCRQFNPFSYYVGQGCELEMFQAIEKNISPPDLFSIKQPIIGYVGAIHSLRLDISLIEYIAIKLPECSIVLVGPEDEQFLSSTLHQMPNVRFLGSKKPEELPAYVNSFDVCINPQQINEVTIGNYPRKVDEYLAVGKPVVATRTESMSVFEQYVYLADNQQEFVDLIMLALKEDDPLKASERKKFASGHTWEMSVDQIYTAITDVERRE